MTLLNRFRSLLLVCTLCPFQPATAAQLPFQPGTAAIDVIRYDVEITVPELKRARSWPYYARYWLPANDHPSDAAQFRFSLRAPPGVTALANGALIHSETSTAEELRVWEQSEPIPTYAAQVTIGEFTSTSDRLCFNATTGARSSCSTGATAVPVQFHFPQMFPNRAGFESDIRKAGDALAYFAAKLGPYRFSKAGFVSAPQPFNIESASLIILVSPGAAVHETLHHWWGKTVQIRTWGDFWISEGLTTYFTGFFDEVTTGVNTACSTRGRTLNVAPDQDPMNQFNSDQYCIGAAAIADYRSSLAGMTGREQGDPTATAIFLRVFRRVYEDHAGRAIDTRAFSRALSLASFDVLRDEGIVASRSSIDATVQHWEQKWFSGLPPWEIPEVRPRRRAVGR